MADFTPHNAEELASLRKQVDSLTKRVEELEKGTA